MNMNLIQFEKRENIAIITLNRPDSLNAFSYDLLLKLGEVLDDLRFDKNIRAVIFTGAGERAFSAGADLKERKAMPDDQVRRVVHTIRSVFQKIADLPQPTIAAVNGYALGGGMELMLACDFRIAKEEAVMGLPETSMAIIPGAGGTQRLPRLIGEMRAKELIFTGRRINAQEAYDLGLLLKVVASDKLLDEAIRLAKQIVKNGPIALQQAKYAINQGMQVDLQTGLEIEGKAYEVTIPTKDRIEALNAFAEKRTPKFLGE
jgi:enoyl-CoA hydratase